MQAMTNVCMVRCCGCRATYQTHNPFNLKENFDVCYNHVDFAKQMRATWRNEGSNAFKLLPYQLIVVQSTDADGLTVRRGDGSHDWDDWRQLHLNVDAESMPPAAFASEKSGQLYIVLQKNEKTPDPLTGADTTTVCTSVRSLAKLNKGNAAFVLSLENDPDITPSAKARWHGKLLRTVGNNVVAHRWNLRLWWTPTWSDGRKPSPKRRELVRCLLTLAVRHRANGLTHRKDTGHLPQFMSADMWTLVLGFLQHDVPML